MEKTIKVCDKCPSDKDVKHIMISLGRVTDAVGDVDDDYEYNGFMS